MFYNNLWRFIINKILSIFELIFMCMLWVVPIGVMVSIYISYYTIGVASDIAIMISFICIGIMITPPIILFTLMVIDVIRKLLHI